MKSLNQKFTLYGSKNEITRTDTVFLHFCEVSKGAVSLQGKEEKNDIAKQTGKIMFLRGDHGLRVYKVARVITLF